MEGDDDEDIGQTMNREMGLDPGMVPDPPRLAEALREDIDDTVERTTKKPEEDNAPGIADIDEDLRG